jgi:S1-C subfamily serine protease
MVGIIGGGVAVLAVIIGLVVWGLNRGNRANKTEQVARADGPPPTPAVADPPRRPPADPPKEPTRQDPPKDPPRPEPPKDPPREDPPKETRPSPEPALSTDLVPITDGALPVEVLRRVKLATLYVKVQMGDGRSATGSGFFEQSTGLILTNAHVVGMLREGAAAPRRVEVVHNSGGEAETPLPAELVAVDREADLALLKAQLSAEQAKTFPRLAVLPARELLETQRVYVSGFPFGEEVNRSVTISATSVSSVHRGPGGVPKRVQVNGGMAPGNSGGPVIDARGNVIGVAVSGIMGTQINFAIPGEAVRAFLEGRVAEVHVAADAVARDGKFAVPVQVMALDPRRRITRIALDYWTGPPRSTPLPASDRPPNLGNAHSPRQTVEVIYDPEKSQGRAELILDAMPEPGKQLWVQPVLTSGGGPAWLTGTSYTLAPPVEEKPTSLTARPRVGKVPVQLQSMSKFKLEGRGGKERTFRQNITARLSEQTQTAAATGSRVRLGVERFDIEVRLNGEDVETSDRFERAVHRDVLALGIDFQVDARGNLTSKKNDLTRVPAQSREVLQQIGEQIQQSFDIVSIPQPGEEVAPRQSWHAKRELPIDMPGSSQTALMKMTYTYRGLREHNGRTVAVLELRGNLTGDRGNATLAGRTTGTALIDQATGFVLQANAVTEATLSVRMREETFQAAGTLEVKLQRDPDLK